MEYGVRLGQIGYRSDSHVLELVYAFVFLWLKQVPNHGKLGLASYDRIMTHHKNNLGGMYESLIWLPYLIVTFTLF